MQPEQRVKGRRVKHAKARTDRRVHVVVRNLELTVRASASCEVLRLEAWLRIDLRRRNRSAHVHRPEPATRVQRLERARIRSEQRRYLAFAGRVPRPKRQRPARIAGLLADDPLEPIEIHAMPGKEEIVPVLAGGPRRGHRRDHRVAVDRGLIRPTRRIAVREHLHRLDSRDVRRYGLAFRGEPADVKPRERRSEGGRAEYRLSNRGRSGGCPRDGKKAAPGHALAKNGTISVWHWFAP